MTEIATVRVSVSPAEALQEHRLPVWSEVGAYYGIPGNDFRGFKIVGGTLGERADPANPWDPDRGERVVPAERVRAPREYLARRFPALANAPLLDAFVCQYENSPDEHLIVDRHPGCDNVWFAGGGSGHGFKLSPALGEMVASLVEGQGRSEPAVRSGPVGGLTVEGVTLAMGVRGAELQPAGGRGAGAPVSSRARCNRLVRSPSRRESVRTRLRPRHRDSRRWPSSSRRTCPAARIFISRKLKKCSPWLRVYGRFSGASSWCSALRDHSILRRSRMNATSSNIQCSRALNSIRVGS
jgi:hypothetical protein